MKVKIYYPFLTTITFLLICNLAFAQWTQKADIPTARSWIESCTIDGKIYLIGGTESTSCNGPSVGTMEVYDPIPDSWDTTKDPMPTSRVEFCACAVNGKIYAIGGATNHSASPLGMVEEYDPLTNTWDTNKTPMPTPRKGAAYGVIDNKIYVAGGTAVANWTASNKLEIYDPVTDEWIDTLATMPIPMYQPTGAVINDTFYVIGGLLGYSPWTGQGTVQMYDPITDNWLLRADLNHPRVGPTANVVAGKIYAIGGDKQPPIVRIVEEYDPNSNSWTDIDSLPSVKILHTASLFDSKIYLFSGSTTSVCNLTPTPVVYSFDPAYLDTIYVPGDYSTIQEAINVALNGNTILVDEGTYYENINYKGKAITVASHFLVDGNETHIANTIIDGSQAANPDSGSVVYFISGEDTTSVLCGFTITGGTGTYTAQFDDVSGGGILLWPSGAKICNNIIEYNSASYNINSFGGGILGDLDGYNIIIENNIIRNNTISGNAWAQGGGIALYNWAYGRILNNKIIDNTVNSSTLTEGGGITCNGSSDIIFIIGNYIKGNECNSNSGGGGGLELYDCTAVVKNNLIVENSAHNGGGIIFDLVGSTSSKSGYNSGRLSIQNDKNNSFQSNSSEILLASSFENNTIVNNSATGSGGGIRILSLSPQFMNFIIWGNTAPSDSQIYGSADVQYSDVEGGWTGTGNIDLDPQFVSTNPYFPLSGTSPCIDAGNPDAQYNDVEDPLNLGNALWPALGTLVNDMGHCGGPASTWGFWDWPMPVEDESTVLSEYILMQNYPNPFNPRTTIKYGITERTYVELRIYDILGREVELLLNEEQEAGSYEINFNAVKLSSGIYFYQLQAGDFIQTKKMILLK